MKLTKFIVAALISTFLGCGNNCPEVELLQWVKKADASSDAKLALKNGDMRYKAVYGITVFIPGAEEQNNNYVAIEGTSDAICSRKHGKLVDKAFEYAYEYNQIINQGKSNAL